MLAGLRRSIVLIGLLALTPAVAEECKVATIAGNPEWSPFMLVGSDGKLGGAGIEIARAAFASLAVEVRTGDAEPWARSLASLESGRIDLVVSAYRTADRAERFLYTKAYAEDPVFVFMKASAPFPVSGIGDLAGHAGVVPFGSNFGDALTAFLRDDPRVTFNTSKEGMFHQLLTPRIDYAILSRHNGERVLKQMGLTDAIVPAPAPLVVNKVYMLMSRKSPCAARLAEFDAALDALAVDGTINRLIAAAESS